MFCAIELTCSVHLILLCASKFSSLITLSILKIFRALVNEQKISANQIWSFTHYVVWYHVALVMRYNFAMYLLYVFIYVFVFVHAIFNWDKSSSVVVDAEFHAEPGAGFAERQPSQPILTLSHRRRILW